MGREKRKDEGRECDGWRCVRRYCPLDDVRRRVGYRAGQLEMKGHRAVSGVDRRLGLGCADGFRDSMIITHVKV